MPPSSADTVRSTRSVTIRAYVIRKMPPASQTEFMHPPRPGP